MEKNLMSYNINELKELYVKTNDDFKKFFIKKAIEYKINLLKNDKLNKNNMSNSNHTNDILDDLLNYSKNEDISDDSESEKEISQIEDKFAKQIKFDSTNNKLLERLNIESKFRSQKRENIKKEFISPFSEDNLYNEQFTNDKYIESINKMK
jgi:hypothetical protein